LAPFASAALLASACASGPPQPPPQAAAITAARVHSQDSPYHPRLALVERDGDPERGVALAVYVGASPSAAFALSLLTDQRVRDAGFEGSTVSAGSSGFIVRALVTSTEDVTRFVRSANAALVAPVTLEDAGRVAANWRASPPRQAATTSEAAVARCSGELLLDPNADGPASIPSRLAPWLASIVAGDAAFAVVGAKDYLEAAGDAVGEIPPWARLGFTPGPSFDRELAGAQPAVGAQQSLSVALWGLPAATALAGAERLGEPDSLLSVRLAAGFPPWNVWRIHSNLSRGGACLRVDLQSSGAPPNLNAIATSVASTVDELEYTLARVRPGPWVVAKQPLVVEAPDEAAAVAAWQAVSMPPPTAVGAAPAPPEAPRSGPARRLVHYYGPFAEGAQVGAGAEGLALPPGTPPPGLELRRGVEPGQGQFWMLLATPCGTGAEDGTSAGSLALSLHAVARGHDTTSAVNLEPWLSVDGMGLLAHSGPASPYESSSEQAERVAEGLMRALLSAGPSPADIAASRDILLEELPSGVAPGLSLALRQTTANHPSYLDARGTWASLTAISARTAQLERERFLRTKLRLASLGNHDEAQLQAAEHRLLALLGSVDAGAAQCPPRGVVSSVPGKYVIDASGVRDADAVVAIPLPPSPGGPSEEALWTEWLMNRPGGWLSQALQRPGLVSTARARAIGGGAAAALVIEIHAVDDKHEEAVAQVRGLLERLRAGAATAADVKSAREHLARVEASRKLNPRGRLVDLWFGSRRPEASVESLHALHRVAFETGREVVVMTRSPEQ
jgi:hypothetical protein